MLEFLSMIDTLLFLFINIKLANPVTDFIMPYITSGPIIIITYIISLALLLWKGNKQLRWMVLFSIIILVFCDQSASTFIKKWICRPRPCAIMAEINLLVGCGAGWSMPSSHAVNVFGQAFFFSFFYKKYAGLLFLYAFLVAISRVFVGVHYPADIITGALLGGIIASVMALVFVKFRKLYIPVLSNTDKK